MTGDITFYWSIKGLYAIARKRIKTIDFSLIIKEEELWKQEEIFLRKQQQLLAESV